MAVGWGGQAAFLRVLLQGIAAQGSCRAVSARSVGSEVLSPVSVGGWRSLEAFGVAVRCKKRLSYNRNYSASLRMKAGSGFLWL